MKKSLFLLVVFCVLSLTIIADDGQIPTGGKNCQQGQSCLTVPADIPPVIDPKILWLDSIFESIRNIFR